MKFDIFTEVQKKDCDSKGGFGQLLKETVEQAKVSEDAGYEGWWQVEHHCSADFSYSSCPELILSAIAHETNKLRLGHAGILVPLEINHWLRSAERSAMLDHISNGRMNIGLARSSGMEWKTFGVKGGDETALNDLVEVTKMLPKAWTEESFSWKSDRWSLDDKNVQPKPVQTPHPPIWHTGSSPSSFERAGEMGVGMLCTTLFTPVETLAAMVDIYKKAIVECSAPAGQFINNQVGVFTFVHVAESEKAAIESGALQAAIWYVATVPRLYGISRELFFQTVRGNLDPRSKTSWDVVENQAPVEEDLDDPNPAVALIKRELAGQELSNEEIYEAVKDIDSVIIGDAATCRKKVEKFRDCGFDRLLCMHQYGGLSHENILSSTRRFGAEIIPSFSSGQAGKVRAAG